MTDPTHRYWSTEEQRWVYPGELPLPALVIGTKLVPYEERHFSSEQLAKTLGYTEDLRRYYSEEQVHALIAANPRT